MAAYDSNLTDLCDAEAWIFDLDNTLYPAKSNLFAQVDVRIRDYVANHLGIDAAAAYRLQKQYFREHGTTMRGMMHHHGMDPGPFLDYVHDIDVSPVPPSPRLALALERLKGRKLIFTNGSVGHAERVTARLGVGHCFETVFDIVASGYVPKPDPGIYAELVRRHGLRPDRTVMVEDLARNLEPAAAMGMTTVWVRTDCQVGREGSGGDHVHHVIDDLAEWLDAVTAPARPAAARG